MGGNGRDEGRGGGELLEHLFERDDGCGFQDP